MKTGISALLYMKNNKRRILVLVLTLGLFMTMLYSISFILRLSEVTFYNAMVERSEKMQFFGFSSANEENISNKELAERFSSLENVDYAFPSIYITPHLKAAIGELGFDAPLVDKENLPIVMDYMGAKLLKGTIPEKPGEVILDEKSAKNMGISIGDTIYTKDFTVTAIASCDSYFVSGIYPEGYTDRMCVVVLSKGKGIDYTKALEDMGYSTEKAIVYDNITLTEDYNVSIRDSIGLPKNIITIFSTVVLCICIAVVFNMYLRDRHEEWCLYSSIGFSSGEIYLLAMRELLITWGLSILMGTVLSATLAAVISGIMVTPMGLMADYIMPDTLFMIFCMLVFLMGIMQIPLMFAISRIKTVDAAEEDMQ